MAEIEVEVDDISTTGDGVARVGAAGILIPFTIPGERVRVELPARPQAGAGTIARLRSIVRPSPHRVAPGCRHFGPDAAPGVGPCGGCTWQHIAYPEQLRLKQVLVDKLISAHVPKAPRALPTLSADQGNPWGYRQKVHFVFAGGGRTPLAMGHYVRGSRRVIPVEECPVHDAGGNDLAFGLQRRLARRRIEAAGTGHGALSSIAIRCGLHTFERMATLVTTHDRDKRLRAATRDTIASDPAVSFHLNLHPARNAFIFGRDTRRLHGAERLREEVSGTSYLLAPTSFFQTNVAAAELLVQLVIDGVGKASTVLDLYAGIGLFSLPLARAGIAVTAVEENREAVAGGIASARLNKIEAHRCRFVNRRVEDAVSTMPAPDAVVLDPPRDGCSTAVLEGVFGRLQPQRAVYVSCNPESLASELEAIVRMGYTIRSIQPVDMFPHTAHIETVVVLSR